MNAGAKALSNRPIKPGDRWCLNHAEWPADDRAAWLRAHRGMSDDGLDNPAVNWSGATTRKHEYAYGRYLGWLQRKGLDDAGETVEARITPARFGEYCKHLKAAVSPVSVAVLVCGLTSAVRALSPDTNWYWLGHRSHRLKLRAKPSREKRHAMRPTAELFAFGKTVMDKEDVTKSTGVAAALRYQSGFAIALLAARPLRIRNFQAITIGESLRWDGSAYWLTFSTADTKTRTAIDEPFPSELRPYLEAFLKTWRRVLLRQASKFGYRSDHGRLWVGRNGAPMKESTLRQMVERYTEKQFGTALWPHLFRDCLLTSIAMDQPDLLESSAVFLGHSNLDTGQKHYNQARMVDASRRFAKLMSELRESDPVDPDADP